MERWSLRAWREAAPVYRQIIGHPFIGELASGTLPDYKFRHYLRQDALYLAAYGPLMAHTAQRLTAPGHRAAYERFSQAGIAVEEALHEHFLGGERPATTEMGAACAHYIALQRSQMDRAVELEAVASLPCFWVYQRVGDTILQMSAAHTRNPYRPWIETYADKDFHADTLLAIDICDQLAAQADNDLRERMTRLFVDCTRAEWGMWEEAWQTPSPQKDSL